MAVPLDRQLAAIEGAVNGEIFDKEDLKAAAITICVLQRDPEYARAFFAIIMAFPGAKISDPTPSLEDTYEGV